MSTIDRVFVDAGITSFSLECKLSGVSTQIPVMQSRHALKIAIVTARQVVRLPGVDSPVIIWGLPTNERIAEVWKGGHWVKEQYRHLSGE